MKTKRPISFTEATSRYVHRFTLDHTPSWASTQCAYGKYYAPQYESDEEWYANTLFPSEEGCPWKDNCMSSNQTWPLGMWLNKPYRKTGPRDFSAAALRN